MSRRLMSGKQRTRCFGPSCASMASRGQAWNHSEHSPGVRRTGGPISVRHWMKSSWIQIADSNKCELLLPSELCHCCFYSTHLYGHFPQTHEHFTLSGDCNITGVICFTYRFLFSVYQTTRSLFFTDKD